jgi:serine/threonine-protein kinase RsbT
VAVKIKMGLVNQTRLITAASELVRNMMRYANGGTCFVEVVSSGRNNGVRLTFADKGPGIADITMAMKDGYSTGKSLGLGLPGTKRLVNEFDIKSKVGEGTTVTIIKWANG